MRCLHSSWVGYAAKGYEVAESTVVKYKVRSTKPPSQSWRTFLDNHVGQIAAVDFLTMSTISFRVLFCFLVLRHDRRKVIHFNVTDHPTAFWTGQQMVEAFPEDSASAQRSRQDLRRRVLSAAEGIRHG